MQDVLRFSSRSAGKRPGAGAGESVADVSAYAELATFQNWRRRLSNFDVADFVYNGRTYRTIEHAFQAAKIELQDPTAAFTFAKESGSELALGDGLAARKARKIVVLTRDNVEKWNGVSAATMASIAATKYAQNEDARRVLAATNNAQLWHVAPRTPAVRFVHLEHIRSLLLN